MIEIDWFGIYVFLFFLFCSLLNVWSLSTLMFTIGCLWNSFQSRSRFRVWHEYRIDSRGNNIKFLNRIQIVRTNNNLCHWNVSDTPTTSMHRAMLFRCQKKTFHFFLIDECESVMLYALCICLHMNFNLDYLIRGISHAIPTKYFLSEAGAMTWLTLFYHFISSVLLDDLQSELKS